MALDDRTWTRGTELFEAGAYWDAHEAWEDAWRESSGVEKHFLSGAILLAAALHKARALHSARGGRRNYAKALKHLALVPDRYHGVDVRELEARVHAALRDPTDQPRIPVCPEAEP
ncbi:MAG: DUF309 domain-containing protein [Deinococcales bacterium]